MPQYISMISPSGDVVPVELSLVSYYELFGYKPSNQQIVINPGTTNTIPNNSSLLVVAGLIILFLAVK